MNVLDLFAGPGGWDVAARLLGLDPLGVELDDAACETRRAVGLRTLQHDVSDLHFPRSFVDRHFGRGQRLDGLIASPPCQDFSAAGKGAGRAFVDDLTEVALADASGRWTETALVAQNVLEHAVPRALLVLEPLRWIKAVSPSWVALEQVPAVLPIWLAIAEGLNLTGYRAWAGLLTAERYGVPQTRARAIMIARRGGPVGEPPATHQRYIAPKRDRSDMDLLFGDDTPDPGRIVWPGDEHLTPWVSMAEALGWDAGLIVDTNQNSLMGTERYLRPASAPASTLTTKADRWRVVPSAYNARDQKCGKTGKPNRMRSIDEPAPTIAVESRNDSWVFDRPATTIVCDPRVWPPGHKVNADDIAAGRDGYGDRAGINAIRITEREAAILQSFPADYPWSGNKGKRFEQIGNAVPPLLAEAVLREALR